MLSIHFTLLARRARRAVPLLAALWLAGADAAAEELEFERVSTDQGLSGAAVHAVLQDRRGFLWVGTTAGLNRYDGHGFTVYRHRPADARSLPDDHVFALACDPAFGLWIGTWNGLARFEPDTGDFLHYRHRPEDPASLSDSHVSALCLDAGSPDRAGTLWIGTRWGLDRLDPASGGVTRLRLSERAGLAEEPHVRSLACAATGEVWVGTEGGGLLRLGPGLGEVRAYRADPADPGSLRDDRVWALEESEDGVLWVGTAGGLDRFDRLPGRPTTGRFRRLDLPAAAGEAAAEDAGVRSLDLGSDGRLWVGTSHRGLYLLDPATGVSERYRHDADDPSSPSSNRIYAIHRDAAGNTWLGTQGGGLNKVPRKRRPFLLYQGRDAEDPAGLIGSQVRSLLVDGRGRLWVGTESGLSRLDLERGTFTSTTHDPERPDSLASNRVRALAEDPTGALWVGTGEGGLDRLQDSPPTSRGALLESPAAGRFVHHPHDPRAAGSLSHDTVTALHVDRSGSLWIGTYRGLNRYDGASGRFIRYSSDPDDPTSLSNHRVTAILEDAGGSLWVGTYAGLNRLGPDPERRQSGRFERWSGEASGLSDDRIWALHEQPAGTLWIGTGGGLDRFDIRAGRLDHLPHPAVDAVYCILGDDRGDLWLSSNRGLLRLDPRTGAASHYDAGDGLQIGEFNPGACARSAGGEMFFGGDHGLNRFRPAAVEDKAGPPTVVLTAFKKFNQPVPGVTSETEEIALSFADSFISFEFAALDFTDPSRNRYAYRLEGFDDGWIDSGARRFASYTNLPAGDYTFRVRGANSDGVWNDDGLSLELHVAPPFWGTWWFRLAVALGVAAVLWSAHALRTRGVEAKNRELAAANAVLSREIERREQAEQERRQVISELEAKNAEMERFTYTVSHDLKSPMITVCGFLGLLEKDLAAGEAERAKKDMERILAAAAKMTQLLDELLELSRIGRLVNEPEEVDLGEVAREAAEMVAGRIAERGIEVEIGELPAAFGDAPRLREVFQNLIENAVKFIGEAPRPRVEVSSRRQGDEDVIRVRDNGIGIDPRYHEKIFGLFDRLDPEIEGTGIGLALVQRIVEVHGGRIWVESEGAGRGSTFCFTLPRKVPGC